MKFSTALTALTFIPSALAMTRAGVKKAVESRRLSFEPIGLNYEPGSQVTDHNAIDLDQAALERQLALATDESFAAAKAIYQEGGHSKSYAIVVLSSPLVSGVSKGTAITGVTADGAPVQGKAYADHPAGETELRMQYITTDMQDSYVSCQVGALDAVGEANYEGCLANTGTVTVSGTDYDYSYDQTEDNNNGRTIAGFSTGAQKKMWDGCPGCPYPAYEAYYNYYGEFDYANQWVLAALDGTETNFKMGNADFSQYGFTGRKEATKKGTAYMNIYMYVIREFYDAIDDCQSGCINCNDDPVHAWDEGVAFYTGSTESTLIYTLGDKRCANYNTCGTTVENSDNDGTSKVNYDLWAEFTQGKFNLNTGNCAAAKINADRIVELMAIPLVQGTLRYAYKVDRLQGAEKEAAEGAVFAAAVLPKIHACSASDAKTIYDNMKVGASSTTFNDVKKAFENNYECLAITCDDIGGLYNEGTADYYPDAEPCKDKFSKGGNALAIGLGSAGAAVGVIALVFVGIMIGKEKSGKPMFAASDKTMS